MLRFDYETKSITGSGQPDFCPRCAHTIWIKQDRDVVETSKCVNCSGKFARPSGTIDWYDENGKVGKEYAPIVERMHTYIRDTYDLYILYLPEYVAIPYCNAHLNGYVKDMCSISLDGTRAILMDLKMNEIKRIVCMAHEAGHFIDYRDVFFEDDTRWMAKDMDHVLQKEKTAWLNAIDILVKVGFDDWTSFVRIAIKSIKTYFNHFDQSVIGAYEFGFELMKKAIYIQLEQAKTA